MLRERSSLVEERPRFRLFQAVTGAEVQHAEAGSQRKRLGILVAGIRTDEAAHRTPMTKPRRGVVLRRPLRGPPVPSRGLETVTGFFPMTGEDRGTLVELFRVNIGDRLRDGGVRAPPSVTEL
jgi:hypothetical protein